MNTKAVSNIFVQEKALLLRTQTRQLTQELRSVGQLGAPVHNLIYAIN